MGKQQKPIEVWVRAGTVTRYHTPDRDGIAKPYEVQAWVLSSAGEPHNPKSRVEAAFASVCRGATARFVTEPSDTVVEAPKPKQTVGDWLDQHGGRASVVDVPLPGLFFNEVVDQVRLCSSEGTGALQLFHEAHGTVVVVFDLAQPNRRRVKRLGLVLDDSAGAAWEAARILAGRYDKPSPRPFAVLRLRALG